MIIWFSGGLGNHMFQYALYRTAQSLGYDVKADLSFYDNKECHNGYELERIFNIRLNKCTAQESSKFVDRMDYFSRVIRKLGATSFGIRENKIIENYSKHIDDLLDVKNKNKYLQGYWQSEKYFKSIESTLKQEFVFPKLIDNKNEEVAQSIKNSNSASIHVRRGDYLSHSIYYALGESNYYNNAINYLLNECASINFYIFSDDIDWCRTNLNLPINTVYIDWNKNQDSYIDMQLMSMCKYNIIANSSFSWWGAFLNKNKEKIVVAPQNWFAEDSGYDASLIVPEDWVKL